MPIQKRRARRVVTRARPQHTVGRHGNVTPKGTTPPTKQVGECPLCGTPDKLTVERRAGGGWWVNCWTAGCRSLGGEWLREVAEVVGAPGGGALLSDPLTYLADYLSHSAAGIESPLPSEGVLDGWQDCLWADDAQMTYLENERGLTERTICRARLGWLSEQQALTIPVYDRDGELVNVVMRPTNPEPGRKYVVWPGRNQHNGGTQLYPGVPTGSWLLVGGLFDALIGRQHHLPAITSTNGISTFLDAWLPLVRGRRVVVMPDVGEEGEMHRLVAKLREADAQAWPVRLSQLLDHGKDLTDYFVQGGTRERLVEFINRERRRAEA
jgi:hypothetical protein